MNIQAKAVKNSEFMRKFADFVIGRIAWIKLPMKVKQ